MILWWRRDGGVWRGEFRRCRAHNSLCPLHPTSAHLSHSSPLNPLLDLSSAATARLVVIGVLAMVASPSSLVSPRTVVAQTLVAEVQPTAEKAEHTFIYNLRAGWDAGAIAFTINCPVCSLDVSAPCFNSFSEALLPRLFIFARFFPACSETNSRYHHHPYYY